MQFNLKTVILGLLILVTSPVIAQQYIITGKVIEPGGSPVPFATVALVSSKTQALLTGTTTTMEGDFEIKTDSVDIQIQVSFMGYEKQTITEIPFKGKRASLGTITLQTNAEVLNEVEVVAEKSSVEFKLDKKVFNVGSDIANTGLGAMDVLNNVPSVNVDIEGEISLRGSTGVQILINGKPSVLADEGANALSSIPAEDIERIEVITNPSAKYQAEGTSGIINIVLKENDKKGMNGSVSVNTGIPNNHSVGLSLNHRTEKFNFFTQMGAGLRTLPRYSETENRNLTTGEVITSDGETMKNETFGNITLGADYYINDRNIITLSGHLAYEDENEPSNTNFYIYDGTGELLSEYKREGTTTASNPKYRYDLQYKKEFKNNKEHTLLLSATGNFFGKDQTSEFLNQSVYGTDPDPNQKTETDFYQSNYAFKLDYTNPLTEKIKIEAGGLYDLNDVGNNYAVYNSETNTNWVLDTGLTNDFTFVQNVLGVYGTGSYEGKKWGVMAGLRLENTDRRTELKTTQEVDNINYTNLFPSIHTSYKINKQISLQAGYSRRISRPQMWDLNPFFNYSNAYSIRVGNPELMPEFGDSYEFTGIFIFEKMTLNSSLYYVYTTDVIESVSYYEDNVNISTPMNIGTRDKVGLEINGKYNAAEWLTLNGDFNFGYFNRKGEFEDQNFDFNSQQWTAKLSGKFKLPLDMEMELTVNYQSEYKTIQGTQSGFAYADAGIRKKLWKGKGVVNVSVRDIFSSRIFENIVDQSTYYAYNFSKRGTFVTLGFSYSFGKGEAMSYSGGKSFH